MENKSSWERETVEKLVFANIKEQRRSRRWGVFFKLLLVLYLVFITYFFINPQKETDGLHLSGDKKITALIDIDGVIAANKPASSENIVKSLKESYKNKNVKGVILRINSPGGSPVQSRNIYNEMQKLQKENPSKKIFAVIEDIGASGGYLIASAADKIYADETSLLGSIGAVMHSFGFVDLIEKLGIERRVYAAGENKVMLDPFLKVKDQQKEMLEEQLAMVHKEFIKNVVDGRGKKLKKTEDMFSGRIWNGVQAKELGLIDDFGSVNLVAEQIIKAPNIVDFNKRKSILDKFSKVVTATVSVLAKELLSLQLF